MWPIHKLVGGVQWPPGNLKKNLLSGQWAFAVQIRGLSRISPGICRRVLLVGGQVDDVFVVVSALVFLCLFKGDFVGEFSWSV